VLILKINFLKNIILIYLQIKKYFKKQLLPSQTPPGLRQPPAKKKKKFLTQE